MHKFAQKNGLKQNDALHIMHIPWNQIVLRLSSRPFMKVHSSLKPLFMRNKTQNLILIFVSFLICRSFRAKHFIFFSLFNPVNKQ